MNVLGVAEMAQKLCGVLSTKPNVVLFAGAGVGKRVGLPDWDQYIEHLASACEQYDDPLSAALMRQRLGDHAHAAAATIFKTSTRIPAGERLALLAAPFSKHGISDQVSVLHPLVGLPFTSIVTTNYDRCLHESYAQVTHSAALPVELDDGTVKGASLRSEFFIARIHGRAELPQTMIVDQSDYQKLKTNNEYLDFLISILTQRSCVFVGFSFLDPAIEHVLDIYKSRVGPNFPALHMALLPDGDSGGLGRRLLDLNVETIYYDPEDTHRSLWQSLRMAYDTCGCHRLDTPRRAEPPDVTSSIHRFLAFAYAQMRVRQSREPVLRVVRDGIVLSVLGESPRGGVLVQSVGERVQEILHVSERQAEDVVVASLRDLEARGDVSLEGNLVSVKREPQNLLDEHMASLTNAVLDRMRVREGERATKEHRAAISDVLEFVFLARAWDIAAHYAGAASTWSTDLNRVIETRIRRVPGVRSSSAVGAISRSIIDLLAAPDDGESELLTELGRAGFALQLVLATPRQVLFQETSLPDRVYLDTNVFMPAITGGHPLGPTYLDAISRLVEASQLAGSLTEVLVGEEFLNEVISHRQKAIDAVASLNLEDPLWLRKHILLYGAGNTNVFIGAYASFVGRDEKRFPFRSFLQQAAPYEDENELGAFLSRFGIRTISVDFRDVHNSVFTDVFSQLLERYEAGQRGYRLEKEKILIQHEAQQLTQLRIDRDEGYRSLFVTSDLRLLRILQGDDRLRDLAECALSQVGLAALVDLMVGLGPDARSYARLVWASPRTDQEAAFRDYFVNLALKEHDAGIAMGMQDVLKHLSSEAAASAEEEGIDVLNWNTVNDAARTARFMDRFEARFFERMRWEIDRREGT